MSICITLSVAGWPSAYLSPFSFASPAFVGFAFIGWSMKLMIQARLVLGNHNVTCGSTYINFKPCLLTCILGFRYKT
jgi:hypothetical protein